MNRSCQVVNARDCINCDLIIAGSPRGLKSIPAPEIRVNLAEWVRMAKSVLNAIAFFGAVLDYVTALPLQPGPRVVCGTEASGSHSLIWVSNLPTSTAGAFTLHSPDVGGGPRRREYARLASSGPSVLAGVPTGRCFVCIGRIA